MCGIFGIVRRDGAPVPAGTMEAMRNAIAHRGPDDSGTFTAPGVALGMNRLAIVDLATGNQPIYNEDRSLVIVYNGELYNHGELRCELAARGHVFRTNCDTETVLHAFEEFGEGCLERFNGMLACAIWDLRRRRLVVARDRLGVKPLYLARWEGGIAFASEPKALLGVVAPAAPDWCAISRFFSFGYVPSPHSAFAGIDKLAAGHYGVWQDGAWRTASFWEPRYGGGESPPLKEAVGEVERLLGDCVERELMGDVPVGLFLSGGLDSSAVALFAASRSRGGIASFALRFEEQTHDESRDARLVARHLGLEHTELLFSRELLRQSLFDVASILDEPLADSTVLPLLVLSRAARERVKVVLTGWGGDEIFAGYPTYLAHRLASHYRKLPALLGETVIPALVAGLPVSDRYLSFEFKAKRFVRGMGLSPELQHFLWMGYLDDAAKKRLFRPAILEQVRQETYAEAAALAGRLQERDTVSRIMHLDARYFLEGNGLFQADRMTMAASLEARVPLLNRELVDYVNGLPVSLKMHGGEPKGLLKEVLKKHLPREIIDKKKKGFGPPSAAWVRGPFSGLFDQLFTRERVEGQGIFNHEEISRLLTEHRQRRADHGRNLWALLSFQLWYDRFISKESL